MAAGGWVVVSTGGSATWGRGWMHAGFGMWFGDEHPRDFHTHVPAHDWQSSSRGGGWGGVLSVGVAWVRLPARARATRDMPLACELRAVCAGGCS